MITTVTLNPAIDRTILLDRLEHGAVNRVKSVREDIGGKGINVAKILNALGEQTQALGFVGKWNYEQVQSLLKKEAISTEFVQVNAATRLNTKIVELNTHITTDINETGFLVTDNQITDITELIKAYSTKSDYVVLSGSVPQGVPVDIYKKIISTIRPYTKIALDADGQLLIEGIKAQPDVIKPNIHELESALCCTLNTEELIIKAGLDLINKYSIKHVLVSMGGEGSILISHNNMAYRTKAIPVKVKGTVGAGDSMLAGFIYGLTNSEDNIELALKYATACGTVAVSQEGTQGFAKHEVEALLSKVHVNPIKL